MTLPRLIVLGASGVIGGALMRAARAAGRQAIGTGLSRSGTGLIPYDMRNAALRTVIPDLGRGDVVYLLAGYISAPWIFANPDAARALNLDASRRVVDEVLGAGARLVFMSTDAVFDGVTGGYTETATPHPLNLYGRLKVAMEEHVLAAGGYGIVARTGWNVAWDKGAHCAVAQCYETLLKPGARMAHDNVISISDVDDTARGLLALAGEASPAHRVYHLVSTPGVARVDLAATVKSTSRWGSVMAYDAVPFASLPYTEPRPVRAFLASERLASLGVSFAPPFEVIRRKVRVLDDWRVAEMADVAAQVPNEP